MIKRRTERNRKLVKTEVELGEHLYNIRARRSEVSGNPLGDDYSHVFASHILTKGAFPKFRNYHKNIVLMTFEEHQLWENYKFKIKDLPEWQWVFRLHDLLIREYYFHSRTRFLFWEEQQKNIFP